MDNSKIKITESEPSKVPLITKSSNEKSSKNLIVSNPVFMVRIDNSYVKKIASNQIRPANSIYENTAPNATTSLVKKSIFAVKIDSLKTP